MPDQIELLLEKAKARSGPELQSDLETITSLVDNLQTENEQLREEKAALQTELENRAIGTSERLLENDERYQQLFQSAFDGIYSTTGSLDEYLTANPAFADLLGYESVRELCASVDSIRDDVFVHSDRYAQYSERLHEKLEINQFEYQVRTADGEIRWVSDSVRTFTDENDAVEGFRGVVIDITEKKNQKEDLKRQTNLGIVLNRVLRHNLRNDLTVIRGFTQLMADKLDGTTNGERALSAIDRLINLSEKARVLDQIVASDAHAEPADIPALIEGVATQMRREYPSATISVVPEGDEEIAAKVLPSFKRAIQELLENGVKHSGDEPRVEVTIEANPNDVQIRIADNGPGIDKQEASVLQSSSETPLFHGSGLGLWLTNWVVTSQDGVIDATTTEEGTTLSVLVPKTAPSEGGQKQLVDMARARDQYKSAFEEAGDGMTITDDEARILDVNKEAARIMGVDKQELLGRPIREFISEDFDFEAEWGEIKAAEMKRGELDIVTGDGGVSPIEYTAKSHIVPGQHLIASRDITERKEWEKEIQEREAKYRRLFEDSRDALMLLDQDGFFDCNQRTLDLFGVESVDKFVKHAPWDLSPATQPDGTEFEKKAKRHVKIAFETGEAFFEWTHRRLDGTEFHAEVKLSRFSHHGNPAIHALVRDISDRKERERVLEGYETIHGKAPNTSDPAEIHVLHVDDSPEIAELVRDMLEREDNQFTVATATSASEGLELITDRPPDCVVSDYNMPGTNGIEFLKAVREEYPDLPFILYTGKGSEDIASEAIAADVTDYLQKDGGSQQYELLVNRIENTVAHSDAEQQVTTTQRRLRELSEAAKDIHWMATADWSEFLFVNSAYEDVFGRSRDEILENPMDFLQGVHPADRDKVTAAMQRASNGEPADFEFRVGADEDVQQWVWVQAEPIYDETGEPTRIAGFIRDITERKERERTLTQTENIVQKINDGAAIVQDGVIKYANPRLLELLGYPEDGLAERPMEDFIAPDYRETVQKRHQARIAGGDADLPDQYEIELLSDDGQRIPVELSITRVELQGQPATLSIVRDVTEQKRRQQKLDVERNRANALFEQVGEPAVEVEFDDETPVIDTVNEKFEQIFSLEESQLVGEDLNEILVPESDRSPAQSITRRVEADEVDEEELELPTAAGKRTFMLRTVPYSLEGVQRAYVIYFGVTDRKRREERFQAFIEQSTDIISILDPDGTYQYQSPSASRILGYDADDVIGDNAFEYVHPDDREHVVETFSEGIANPETALTAEYRYQHGDGSWIWLESIGNVQVDNPAIEGMVVNSRDISERKERERRVQRERDRLDKFAGTLSHDLQNPLNVAQGRLALAQEGCDSKHLEQVARAHDRMETLIDDVLSLARAGEAVGETQATELPDLIDACWRNVETESARIVTETADVVQVDESRLQQLFENLFANAVEHAGEDVRITVGRLDDGFYVEDDGAGIPPDERDVVFDAGHSASEEGTGFGLSIVKEVVEAHDWDIRITEGSEGGARFEFNGVDFGDW